MFFLLRRANRVRASCAGCCASVAQLYVLRRFTTMTVYVANPACRRLYVIPTTTDLSFPLPTPGPDFTCAPYAGNRRKTIHIVLYRYAVINGNHRRWIYVFRTGTIHGPAHPRGSSDDVRRRLGTCRGLMVKVCSYYSRCCSSKRTRGWEILGNRGAICWAVRA